MKNQRGFIHWAIMVLVIVIAVSLVAIAWYYEANNSSHNNSKNETVTYNVNANTNSTNTNTNEANVNSTPVSLNPVTIDNVTALTLKNCIDNLAEDDLVKYDFLKFLYAGFHPELSVAEAGSYCEFSNNMKIVSFSYQLAEEPVTSGQSMAVFDADNNYINETSNFYCPTLGDLLTPHFKSLSEGVLASYCWSSDGAVGRYEEYNLNLADFSYEKTKSEEGENITLENMLSEADEEEPEPEPTMVTKTNKYIYNDVMPTSLTILNEYSIATTAQVRKPEGITLSDIEVKLYDSPLLDTQYGPGRVSDVKCNEQYCLMTIRSAGWQYRVLKFENGNFTNLSDQIPDFVPGQISQLEFAWNDSYWLVDVRDTLYKYDGSKFTEIQVTNSEYQDISTLAWNGQYWLIGADMPCCVYSSESHLIKLDKDGNFIERIPILLNVIHPKIKSISWGNNTWLIGANEQESTNITNKLLKYSGVGEPEDISSLLPNTGRLEQIFWDGSEWLFNFYNSMGMPIDTAVLYSYDGEKMKDVSNRLKGFDETSISTISGRANFYAITGYIDPVVNVVLDGKFRDLSGYFAMYVYSGTTYANQVFIGGDSELEILTFHYEPKRTYTSEKINEGNSPVTAVTLKPTQETPTGTAIAYQVSQDGGQTWQTATPNQEVTFSGSGTDLRWQADLTTTDSSQTPSISFMEIDYVTIE